MAPSAGALSNQQAAEQATGDGAAAAADRVQCFRHIRTLSDDEDYVAAPAGITESEADTDELLGRVDWALAANSDEENDVPLGWVCHCCVGAECVLVLSMQQPSPAQSPLCPALHPMPMGLLAGALPWVTASTIPFAVQAGPEKGNTAAAAAAARPPGGHVVQQQPAQAAASSTAAAMPRGSALQQPLNTEDWMFDIGRSSNSTAAAVAAGMSGGSSTVHGAAGSTGSSSLTASSSQLPVHPGQMGPAEAEAAAAAAATRLAQVDAAAAAAAARNAAAAAAAATRGSRRASEPDPAGGSAAAGSAAGRPADTWEHLAQVRAFTPAACAHGGAASHQLAASRCFMGLHTALLGLHTALLSISTSTGSTPLLTEHMRIQARVRQWVHSTQKVG